MNRKMLVNNKIIAIMVGFVAILFDALYATCEKKVFVSNLISKIEWNVVFPPNYIPVCQQITLIEIIFRIIFFTIR